MKHDEKEVTETRTNLKREVFKGTSLKMKQSEKVLYRTCKFCKRTTPKRKNQNKGHFEKGTSETKFREQKHLANDNSEKGNIWKMDKSGKRKSAKGQF